MAQNFRYYAQPDEVQAFLVEQGYHITPLYSRENKLIGFTVENTDIQLSYSIIRKGQIVGYGLVTLWYSSSETDLDKLKRSKQLYRQLKKRFGKPLAPEER